MPKSENDNRRLLLYQPVQRLNNIQFKLKSDRDKRWVRVRDRGGGTRLSNGQRETIKKCAFQKNARNDCNYCYGIVDEKVKNEEGQKCGKESENV